MQKPIAQFHGPLHDFDQVKNNDKEIVVCGLTIEADNPETTLDILGALIHRHVVGLIPSDNNSSKIAVMWCDRSFSLIFEWGLSSAGNTKLAIDGTTYERIQKESGAIRPMPFVN
jgi:hypothetical protein